MSVRNATHGLAGSCEQCGSTRIQWFTPLLRNAENGIFLCLACAKINVRVNELLSHAFDTP